MTQHQIRSRDAGNIQANLSKKFNGMAVSEEATIFSLCNFLDVLLMVYVWLCGFGKLFFSIEDIMMWKW